MEITSVGVIKAVLQILQRQLRGLEWYKNNISKSVSITTKE